ncbi:hypothetical protein IAQ61_006510 [Plenodomus lingam]|uniref:uncharacterized protein n=1 Tax=Leptosphaeria maculans TaxID=5022 RepID=UPI0033265701|nr:hypothetical protein IAQ61_006510 [Plenodomus lingam]
MRLQGDEGPMRLMYQKRIQSCMSTSQAHGAMVSCLHMRNPITASDFAMRMVTLEEMQGKRPAALDRRGGSSSLGTSGATLSKTFGTKLAPSFFGK